MINSYVAVDLETTGIGAKLEKITEIGMVKVVDGQVTDTYHLSHHGQPAPGDSGAGRGTDGNHR